MSDLEDSVHEAAQPFDKHLVNLRVIAGYLAMNLEKIEDEIRETEAARVKAMKKAMGKS